MKEIRKIIDDYKKDKEGQSVLATVVSLEESSYRRIGARMLVHEDGNWIGGISGGCLEGDALLKAQQVLHTGQPKTVTYDTLEDDEYQVGVGLGCNGKIDVLITAINPSDPSNPIQVLESVVNSRQENILVQCIDDESKWCGRLFHALEVSPDVDKLGIEPRAWKEALEMSVQKKKSFVEVLTTSEGERRFLFEYMRPEIRAIIVGDNYDINAFTELTSDLGWTVDLVGTIRKFDKETFARANKVVHYDDVAQLKLDEYTAVLLMSHDYKRDMQMAIHFLQHQPNYLGILGPRKRTLKMNDEILRSHPHLHLLKFENLHSPMGLDIGAETPEEIALSIQSEILQVFRQSDGKPLRDKTGTIHTR